jgi:hypothetical protein
MVPLQRKVQWPGDVWSENPKPGGGSGADNATPVRNSKKGGSTMGTQEIVAELIDNRTDDPQWHLGQPETIVLRQKPCARAGICSAYSPFSTGGSSPSACSARQTQTKWHTPTHASLPFTRSINPSSFSLAEVPFWTSSRTSLCLASTTPRSFTRCIQIKHILRSHFYCISASDDLP